MPDRLMEVTCPTCGQPRLVTRTQHWQITSPKGRSSGQCKSCSLLGHADRTGGAGQFTQSIVDPLARSLIGTAIWHAWRSMKARCSNPKRRDWPNYGGRGIRVCGRWQDSFENFVADMHPTWRPGLSIERIDNDGDYEPGNCRWATRREQAWNTRRSIHVTFRSETRSLGEWSSLLKVESHRLRRWFEAAADLDAAFAALESRRDQQ